MTQSLQKCRIRFELSLVAMAEEAPVGSSVWACRNGGPALTGVSAVGCSICAHLEIVPFQNLVASAIHLVEGHFPLLHSSSS